MSSTTTNQDCWRTCCARAQGVRTTGTRGSQYIERGSFTRRKIYHGAIIAFIEGVDNGDSACVEYRVSSLCNVVVSGERKKRWAAKATELNRHTTRMKIRGSVVS